MSHKWPNIPLKKKKKKLFFEEYTYSDTVCTQLIQYTQVEEYPELQRYTVCVVKEGEEKDEKKRKCGKQRVPTG